MIDEQGIEKLKAIAKGDFSVVGDKELGLCMVLGGHTYKYPTSGVMRRLLEDCYYFAWEHKYYPIRIPTDSRSAEEQFHRTSNLWEGKQGDMRKYVANHILNKLGVFGNG